MSDKIIDGISIIKYNVNPNHWCSRKYFVFKNKDLAKCITKTTHVGNQTDKRTLKRTESKFISMPARAFPNKPQTPKNKDGCYRFSYEI